MKRVIVRLILLIGAALGGTAIAGPLEDATAAYVRGDYATALPVFRSLADQGNPTAQVSLGYMYANGRGVVKDDAEAVEWFRKAAEQGDASGQNELGRMPSNKNRLSAPFQTVPRVLEQIKPRYPEEAIRAGISGKVTARLLIDEKGNVLYVNIVQSNPVGVFDSEVVRALSMWKFQPDGKKHSAEIPVNFDLEEGDKQRRGNAGMSSEQGNYVIYAIILVGLLFVLWIKRDSRIDTLGTLAEVLGPSSKESKGVFDSQLEGRYGGRSVTLGLHDAVLRGDRRKFYVLLESRLPFSYRGRLANAAFRIAKKLHFSQGVATGDAELDSRYSFSSSEPERFTKWVLGSNKVRDAFKALLEDRGVDVLFQGEVWLNATMYNYSDEQTSAECVRRILDAMIILAQPVENI